MVKLLLKIFICLIIISVKTFANDIPYKTACNEDEWVKKVEKTNYKCLASSTLKDENKINYHVNNILDNRQDSCWCGEKEKNEFIIYKIPFGIKGIKIINGVAKNKSLFHQNNRVKKLYIGVINKFDIRPNDNYLCKKNNEYRLTYQTTTKNLIIMRDTFEPQSIYFEKIIDWNDDEIFKYHDNIYLIIGIVDIYKGSKYNDTCITEIEIIK